MSIELSAHIAALESLGLIQPVLANAVVEYRFRHALLHDAAYSTMLRKDRRLLHQAVGEVLEHEPISAGDDLDPLLGRHFFEAGDLARASRYFGQAGRSAEHKYAHAEALAYYSQAIQAAEQSAKQPGSGPAAPPLAALLCGRARVSELQGAFDRARADYEQSAEAARAAGSQSDEWQALLSLALLWSQRDYDRSGEYCQRALELAQQMGEPVTLARSYNRLGNYRLNIEQPREAVEYHQRALAIFQTLHDETGMAETLDLLGMSCMLGGQLIRGTDYWQQAIEVNQRLGDRLALAHCLGSQLFVSCCTYQNMSMRPGPLAGHDLTVQGRQALRTMQESGWRAGEAYVAFGQSYYALSHGDYASALASAAAAQQISTSIGHRQWLAASHHAAGAIYVDLLDWPRAIDHFEAGLALSRQIRSRHWASTILGTLGLAQVEAGRLEQAGRTLAAAGDIQRPPQSAGQRMVWVARARLALARGQQADALAAIEDLVGSAEPQSAGQTATFSPRLLLMRGDIFAKLGRVAEAEADYRAGAAVAAAHHERPNSWRLHAALARLLQAQGHADAAEHERGQARRLIAELAGEVPDPELRETFQRAAEGGL